MSLWIWGGISFAILSLLIRKNDNNGLIEQQLFTQLCIIVASIQISMTMLLFMDSYTRATQTIVWGIPWMLSLYRLIKPLASSDRAAFGLSGIHWTHIVILLVGLGYLWQATPPPWMRDSLTYHLALAKQYAIAGTYTQTDLVIFAYFPQGWQSILTAIHDPNTGQAVFNPRYFSVLICMSTALGLFGWLKEHTNSDTWSVTGALAYLLTPSVIEFGTSCYVQPWLTAVCLWILMSLQRKRPAFAIGLLVGLACSLKYSALILPILILPIVYSFSKSLKQTVQFIGGVCILGLLFYIRNFVDTGNPLFPMMYNLFGGTGWDNWRSLAYEHTLDNYGMGRSLIDYILLPLRLFTSMDMTGSFQGSLGIGWLGMLFAAIWKRRTQNNTSPSDTWMWMFLGGWFVFWAFQVQQVRFFLPLFPIIPMLTIPTLAKWQANLWGIWLCISMMWSIKPIQQLIENQQGHVYWEALEENTAERSNDLFLDHRLPENHPVYTHINEMETNKVWLVWMRGYHYYLDGEARIDNVFGATRFERLLFEQSLDEVYASLKNDNISHIVINWRFFLRDNNADYLGKEATTVIQDAFTQLIQTNRLRPLQQWGPVWLYELEDSSSSE